MTGIRRRWLVGGAILLLSAAGSLALASPAAAEDTPEVLLSADGVIFSPTFDGDLLNGLGMLIPRESVTSTVWVKNPTDADVALRVSVRRLDIPSPVFAEGVSMSVESSSTPLRSSSIGRLAQCDVVIPPHTISAGEAEWVTVTFAMGDLDGTSAQAQAASLDLMVSMREERAGFGPSACDDDGTVLSSGAPPRRSESAAAGSIAATGSELPVTAMAIAAALLGSGLWLTLGRRHRSDDR